MKALLDRARFRASLLRFAVTAKRVAGGSNEGGEGDGGEAAAATATNEGGNEGGDAATQPAAPDKTFTQADVDRMIEERLKRAEPKYAELRKKADEFDKAQEAQLSELDRERKAREKAEQEAAKRIERADRRLIEAAVLAQATKHKAVKPEHLHRLIDTEAVTVGDDGQVTGAEEAVTAFLEANPEYVGGARANGSADQGARKGGANQLTREELASMSPDEIRKATAEGRLSNVLGS